jgi:hypothetical protein
MKQFLKSLLFFIIPLILLVTSGLFLPATPREKKSLIFSSNFKDSLLQFTNKPRIIILGGSNASFGINSQLLKDSLKLNPINIGITANIGLKYILENSLQYIKKGDLVLLSIDYNLYYLNYEYVSDDLLRLVYDASPNKTKFISFNQFKKLLEFHIPKFSFSKFAVSEYLNIAEKESDVYGSKSYNKYGDAVAHWRKVNPGYKPITLSGKIKYETLNKIEEFKNKIKLLGATAIITYPGIDSISFVNSKDKIKEIDKVLKLKKFDVLDNYNDCIIDPKMIYDHPLHLNKKGSFNNTLRIIRNIKTIAKL